MDIWSHQVFVRALKNKQSKTVRSALEDIFQATIYPSRFESDQGIFKQKIFKDYSMCVTAKKAVFKFLR